MSKKIIKPDPDGREFGVIVQRLYCGHYEYVQRTKGNDLQGTKGKRGLKEYL